MPAVSASAGSKAAAAGEPSPSLRVDLAQASRRLETASPPEIIAWAVERFGSRLTMATAFGPEGCLILHWLAAIAPQTYVFNLETGYQFPETLALRDRIAARYGLEVALERPETSVAEYEQQHSGPLYRTAPDRCCGDRKLAVIRRVLARFGAWMSGIRRDQSPDRAAAPIVGWDAKFGVVKISPLANWTKARVWETIVREDVPYNPLHDQGYVSIGCAPCTRPVNVGEDERAGRWSGTAKTECGLHSRG
ncbi:MAG: phosphoadenylyl-sulfate reductase [Planctomycetota bacterium]|jgi:phosphoadenosine phosphosulfate reductase|nr:phosphoadenylyl-sulfate reductase [Planctomycetota bacterium]MDA1201198.1 phosphoadenylyl-sulfate reductase [Planctomycetota bacterium]